MAIFGLPFLLGGLAVIGGGLSGWLRDANTGDAPQLIFILLFGCGFTAVGVGFVLGRSGVSFDRRTKQATVWWGLLIPLKKSDYPLDSLEQVAITKEVRRSKNSTYTIFPVRVTHAAKPIKISEFRDFQKARGKAEEVAKFLNLPVADSTEGQTKMRAANELDQSIRDQAQAKGATIEVSPPPANCRVRHELANGKLTLEIPPVGMPTIAMAIMAAIVLLPMIFAGIFAFFFLETGDTPPFMKLFIAGFAAVLLIPVFLIFGRMFLQSRATEQLTVTPDGLELRLVTPLGRRAKSIPANELEEFDLRPNANVATDTKGQPAPQFLQSIVVFMGGGGAIIARSDRQTLSFGKGLSADEARWMHGLMKRILTS